MQNALRVLDDLGWTLTVEPLPTGIMGLTTFATKTITISPGLTPAETRCTLVHEAIHAERGPTLESLEAQEELRVCKTATRRLIPFSALSRAFVWASTVEELAEELGVDTETVRCRLKYLHPSERMQLAALVRARDDGPAQSSP